MSSFLAKPGDVKQGWHLVDADDKVVGRLAVEIARILIGKHRPEYTPHVDTGEFVVVVNAEKVKFTGNKMNTKVYQWYTGYPGGRKLRSVKEMLVKRPEQVLKEAIRRMMPKNKLARHQSDQAQDLRRAEHPHQAQQVQPLEFKL